MTQKFDPSEDARAFRHALGAFATGVTVVTAQAEGGPAGITANSFASVSLDPPLVLWSPAKASSRFAHFSRAPYFAIHILAADQGPVCDGFTRSMRAFEGCDWAPNAHGVPILSGALAVFECAFEAAHPAGDHDIVLGRVLHAHRREGRPLVFHAGQFGEFATGV